MKKKIILVTIFFICGIANSFCNENPLVFLDFNKELKIDSLKPVLEEKGYSWFEESPSIYGTNIYGDYEVKCYGNGAADQYKISMLHTPTSRIVYSITINREISKKGFLQEAITFYKIIENKYGMPVSGALLNGDYFYADTDEDNKEKINTNKIKLDSAYLVSCFDSSQAVEYYWSMSHTSISFSIHQLSNYNPHITCKVNYGRIAELNTKEIRIIEAEKQAKERKNKIINVIMIVLGCVVFFFIAKKGYVNIKKEEEKRKAKQKAEEEKRTKKQKEIDIRHEEYKRQLINKYGSITRIISNNLYNDDFIMNYDEIFVFEKPKKIIFGKKEYDFADILNCSLYDANHKDIPPTQVTRTNTGSMLGRAAVGGLTLGVAGAVVGAMTAKTESTSSTASSDYIASYIVKIGVKSIEKPTLTLKYGSDKSKAEEVYALIQAIIAMK